MQPFPNLELVWSPIADPPLGTTWSPVPGERLRLGRRNAFISIPSPVLTMTHAELMWEGERWKVRDLKSTNGLLLDGEKVPEVVLQHGTIFSASPAVVFRYAEHAEPGWPEGSEPFLEQLRSDVDDRAQWLVFGDWLLERGHPLGERIALGIPRNDDEAVRWLGPLGPAYRRGAIKVAWRFGMVEFITLGGAVSSWRIPWVLERLASLTIGASLRGIELAEPVELPAQRPASVMRCLETMTRLPTSLPLKQLRLEGVRQPT